jgi:hypothetical protein
LDANAEERMEVYIHGRDSSGVFTYPVIFGDLKISRGGQLALVFGDVAGHDPMVEFFLRAREKNGLWKLTSCGKPR